MDIATLFEQAEQGGLVGHFAAAVSTELRALETYELYSHPATGTLHIKRLTCRINRLRPDLLELTYEIEGLAEATIVPEGSGLRRDGLWKSTCFELFVRSPWNSTYRELNFSPGGDWAAYQFSGYRDGQHNLELSAAPRISLESGSGSLVATVRISLDDLESGSQLGIAAVVEEADFGLSYWSIWHAGGTPDFHDPTCFAATLPPPEQP
jgi:hypothetical protein